MSLPNYDELTKMSKADLITKYNNVAQLRTGDFSRGQAEFFLGELARRETRDANRWMVWLTVAILVLTAANVVLVWRVA